MHVIDWNLEEELKRLPKLNPDCKTPEYVSYVRKGIKEGLTKSFQRYLNTLGEFVGIEFSHMPYDEKADSDLSFTKGVVNFNGMLSGSNAQVHLGHYLSKESCFVLELALSDYARHPLNAKRLIKAFKPIPNDGLHLEVDGRKDPLVHFQDIAKPEALQGILISLHDNLPLYIALSKLVEIDRPFKASAELERSMKED